MTNDFFCLASGAGILAALRGSAEPESVDRRTASSLLARAPFLADDAKAQRAYTLEQMRLLADRGIGQFIDLGCGLPTRPALHDPAAAARPGTRVLYCDADPEVIRAHQRELRRPQPPRTEIGYLHAVLTSAGLRQTIDLSEPVALILTCVLPFVQPARRRPLHTVLEQYKTAVVPGSAIVVTHWTSHFHRRRMRHAMALLNRAGLPATSRSRRHFAQFFRGWKLQPPGITPTPPAEPGHGTVVSLAGTAVKPEAWRSQ
ncbi:SAM-dependent methyltransferase [Streptomyces sp. NPDC055025]